MAGGGMPPMMAMMDTIPLSPETHEMVLSIMNSKYPQAISMYARYYGKHTICTEASLQELSTTTFVVGFKGDGGQQKTCSLNFMAVPAETPMSVATVGDARRAFVNMARHAAQKLGEHIDLPPESATAAPPAGADGGMEAMLNQMGGKGGKGDDMNPEALAGMMAMMAKAKGKGKPSEEELAQLMQMMALAKGKGKGDDSSASASAGSAGGGAQGNIRTLHGGGGASADPMAQMMAQMMQGKGGGKAAPAPVDKWANLGQGQTCGGGSSASAAAESTDSKAKEADPDVTVRPVDPAAPSLQLKVRLPDKKTVTLTFNGCHTLAEVRAYLQINHGESFSAPYVLMDVGGFPPKKLADLGQSLDAAGIANGASLDCRKA